MEKSTKDLMKKDKEHERLKKALLIRRFEERLLSLFSEGKLNGTVHTCIGQEWSGIAISEVLTRGDTVFSNHRGHGHYLSRTGDLIGLLAEVMGRSTGVSGGVGGTQHLFGENFYSSGVQGGMTPVAVGSGLALKLQGQPNVSVAFIGDGTLGQGVLYESLNIASKWEVPVVFVVENNGYAQSTRSSQTTAGSIEGRAAAFDIRYWHGSTWEWKELVGLAAQVIEYSRREQKPAMLEIDTYRLSAHSKGDDDRDPSEIEQYYQRDPLTKLEHSDPELFSSLDQQVKQIIDAAEAEASLAPLSTYRPAEVFIRHPVQWTARTFERERHVDLIHRALREAFEQESRLIMIGEDVEGPYGGAFKVTRDLSSLFPGRIRNTPISESATIGIASGLALNGLIPLVEIMFGDFLTLAFDQLYQHAAKFHDMYNGQCQVPLVLRTPMGGRRGYGPTHSQSIEKFFLGIPGLRVLALNNRFSPYELYTTLFSQISQPTLVVENKVLYTRFLDTEPPPGFMVEFSDELFPATRVAPQSGTSDVTVVCYGGSLEEVEKAIPDLFYLDEVLCEIICPSQIHPLNIDPILTSVAKTGRLLVVEEGPAAAGFGSEVIARVAECTIQLRGARRLGYDGVVPACLPLELSLLPSASTIIQAIRSMIHEQA
jgi:2-oxoisovalerate dehydrogenase E1 component